MALIFCYLGFMAAGDVAAYLLGSTVEYEWGSQVSLIVFLALYFLFLWIAWVLAVWVPSQNQSSRHRLDLHAPNPPRSAGWVASQAIRPRLTAGLFL